MSEHSPETGEPWDGQPDAEEAAAGSQELAEPVRTGVEEVDDVLASVEGLDARPVDEHVAVFEHAHEQLRRSLDGRPDA